MEHTHLWILPMLQRERERERELPEFFRVTVERRGVEFTTVAILERLLSGRRMEWKSLESCESAFQFSKPLKS
ncbi:hypothetical protein OIU77_019516 [Salix suchowensis]|uniref:Uncharacterized protein n=1 Tax=Salix suchowensis TaxID=1278906 RepID=A0ABQ9CJN7_9ROSI|nr:hypothetical protein OIU77_019516 [Salix suchowensis]